VTANDEFKPFQVSMSSDTAEELRHLYDLAATQQDKEAFLQALRHIDSRLLNDPLNFGEELFELRKIRAIVKLALRLPIAIEFGGYPEQRIVLIRYLYPGS
jgi:hypothetical protein